MNEALAGARLQLKLFRRNAGHLLIFVSVPFLTAIFLSSIRVTGRLDLQPYAILAPALMGLWVVSLDLAGVVLDSERRQGTLELFMASPGVLTGMMTGRVAVVSCLGMLTFLESWLTARLFFAVHLPVHHPWLLVGTLVATCLATIGVATVLAGLFVMSRAASRFANALGYPFYLLGGVLVPVTYFPDWLRPLSWLTYLYWSADLLRAVTSPLPVDNFPARVAVLLVTGAVTYLAGAALVRRMLVRLRAEGSVTFS
ncbi:ABC transporter permease [Streptomyces sp. NBC_01205]|uniref:ABC transporter permease n=1 Tax=Streptomyces sp. NBC_01205 TaxID=2903771 RepID=UPI002E1409FC|nr:ABC transporter permease [Streptomyces sp. NBC_01205]